MEQINRIELLGTVGSVRLQNVAGKRMSKFTVVTNRAYKNKEGAPVIETQWHNVTAFEGRNVRDLELIEKGRAAHVWGRLQVQHYTGVDGTDRISVDIICNRLELVDRNTEIQYEM
ncbi:MAG: single-stranded DNA-binding protein [Bacteroidales bacterium]|nr:single-stranded DNA-binding protein [Bacteroidales bacterium]